jgi:hypothetical protein
MGLQGNRRSIWLMLQSLPWEKQALHVAPLSPSDSRKQALHEEDGFGFAGAGSSILDTR